MSQIDMLEENLVYLERFSSDVKTIKLTIESRDSPGTFDSACQDIFENVRAYCETQIESEKENNIEAAQYVMNFSNNILRIISGIRERKIAASEKIKHQSEIMGEILKSTADSSETLASQIKELKIKESEVKFNEIPPIRQSQKTSHPVETEYKTSENNSSKI